MKNPKSRPPRGPIDASTRSRRWWRVGWGVAVLLSLGPQMALLGLGGLWLFEHGWLWTFLIVSAGLVAIAAAGLRWLGRSTPTAPLAPVEPSGEWPTAGDAAWRGVEELADRLAAADPPLDRAEPWRKAAVDLIEIVAKAFHPTAREPIYEVRIPDLLGVTELVARDLGRVVRENVPGSHIVTLGDIRRLRRLAPLGWRAYLVYRIAYLGLNPAAGILRELRDYIAGDVARNSAFEIKRAAVAYAVRRAGFYAIELYSGKLMFDAETGQALGRGELPSTFDQGPLRVLILGEVKAGKSSLVNAMFGQVRSAVDVIPKTRDVEAFELVRDGVERALILDTPGYAGIDDRGRLFDDVAEAVIRTDLVLVVVSATSAARSTDRQALDQVREIFQPRRDRAMPPVLAVLTHVDLLRPVTEWSPPYDLTKTDRAKSRSILECMRVVAKDLAIDTADVVPVCLAESRVYNVEEGLLPTVAERLPRSSRARYLRCLKEHRDAEFWDQLWRQAIRSGRLLARVGATIALDAAERRLGRP